MFVFIAVTFYRRHSGFHSLNAFFVQKRSCLLVRPPLGGLGFTFWYKEKLSICIGSSRVHLGANRPLWVHFVKPGAFCTQIIGLHLVYLDNWHNAIWPVFFLFCKISGRVSCILIGISELGKNSRTFTKLLIKSYLIRVLFFHISHESFVSHTTSIYIFSKIIITLHGASTCFPI